MTIAICTSFENDYHLGVGALVNSLFKSGFHGDIFVFYRGEIPYWFEVGRRQNDSKEILPNIIFVRAPDTDHIARLKPQFILDVFNYNQEIDGVFYFDADIVITTEWDLFTKWIDFGIALCSDVDRYMMHPTHPVKCMWKEYLSEHFGYWRDFHGYANSGFVGVSRRNRRFVEIWREVLQSPQANAARTQDPATPFSTWDQDAMNAAIHFSDIPISLAGQAEMGFFSKKTYMAHAIGRQKPWRRGFIRQALRGHTISFAAKQYWKNVKEPIHVFSSRQIRMARIEMKIARFLATIHGHALS